jgi:hypothetical protein
MDSNVGVIAIRDPPTALVTRALSQPFVFRPDAVKLLFFQLL